MPMPRNEPWTASNDSTPLRDMTSPAHPVDLRVQEPAIRRERLHRSARRRRTHERHEIGWLQLRVDELVETLTRVLEALGREAQVVNDQRNRALHLFLR